MEEVGYVIIKRTWPSLDMKWVNAMLCVFPVVITWQATRIVFMHISFIYSSEHPYEVDNTTHFIDKKTETERVQIATSPRMSERWSQACASLIHTVSVWDWPNTNVDGVNIKETIILLPALSWETFKKQQIGLAMTLYKSCFH